LRQRADRGDAAPCLIFRRGKLIGYVLVRLFFPRRVVSGIWVLPQHHDLGLAVAAVRASGVFTKSEGLPDYVTSHRQHPLPHGGWWYYFPVAFAVKVPMAITVLAGLAIAEPVAHLGYSIFVYDIP
jgi:hypothetical protein